jgi:hypothetical protein
MQIAHERDRFVHGLEHLPVSGDEWCAHKVLARLTPRAGDY